MPTTTTLYDTPDLYDLMVPPGPCEGFYLDEALAAGGPVLDLACGTGRLTIPLALAGIDVTGLDSSEAMLAAARRKAKAAGANCAFQHGDMRTFTTSRRYALVIVTCNSLSHLLDDGDLRRCFAAVSACLAPNGRIALDVVNPDKPRHERAAQDWVVRRPRDARPKGVEEHMRYDPETRIATLRFSTPAADGRTVLAPMRLRRFTANEAPDLLRAAGFTLRGRYGGFDRRSFGSKSPHQIILAERTAAADLAQAA